MDITTLKEKAKNSRAKIEELSLEKIKVNDEKVNACVKQSLTE